MKFLFFIVVIIMIISGIRELKEMAEKRISAKESKNAFYEWLKREQDFCLAYLEAIYYFAKEMKDPFTHIYFYVAYNKDYDDGYDEHTCRADLCAGSYDHFSDFPAALRENPPLKDIIKTNLPNADKPLSYWFSYRFSDYFSQRVQCYEFQIFIRDIERFFRTLAEYIRREHPEWKISTGCESITIDLQP